MDIEAAADRLRGMPLDLVLFLGQVMRYEAYERPSGYIH